MLSAFRITFFAPYRFPLPASIRARLAATPSVAHRPAIPYRRTGRGVCVVYMDLAFDDRQANAIG